MMLVRKQRIIGAVIGLLLPAMVFLFVYLFNRGDMFAQFLKTQSVLPKVVSLCVLPNLAAFFVAIYIFNKDSIAYGILAGTIVMSFVVATLYFLF